MTSAGDSDTIAGGGTRIPRRRTMAFAAQELRLISALVVLLALGLFLALPFVLSIGAVVFLPLVAGVILTAAGRPAGGLGHSQCHRLAAGAAGVPGGAGAGADRGADPGDHAI